LYQISFYRNERGDEPVHEFIQGLSLKTHRKIAALFQLLEIEGPNLRRPYADYIGRKLYELRIRFGADQIRIFYFFFLNTKIILVHAIRKQTQALDVRDIDAAHQRMQDLIKRYHEGKIQFEG
jgi:phage-related protein